MGLGCTGIGVRAWIFGFTVWVGTLLLQDVPT